MRQENVSLAKFTTIGTGGPARWFARRGREGKTEARVGRFRIVDRG